MIYFDQAATSFPKPPAVLQAVQVALQTLGNSGRGAHALALEANRLVFEARESLARFFNAENPSRLAFTANATESLNTALYGLLGPGDHVVTTQLEHNSVLRPLYQLKAKGVEVGIIPSDRRGVVAAAKFKDYLQPNTKAVVCTGASNVTGNVLDVALVGELCAQRGIIFILDAAQTAGFFPLDVQKQKIDVLCFSGHKGLYGPQGIGGVYVREGLAIRPLKVGGSGIQTFEKEHPRQMPEALEAGTLNTPGISGLLAGVRYIEQIGLASIRHRENGLAADFYKKVRGLGGVKFYGDLENPVRCPIVALNMGKHSSALVSQLLAQDYGIFTRPGGHCAPLMHQALGTEKQGVVRFSFSHLNTEEEIEKGAEAVAELAKKLGEVAGEWGQKG